MSCEVTSNSPCLLSLFHSHIAYAYQTASLSFGLGIIGIIVGFFGLANGAFNLYVYYRREDVRKELEKQTKEILEEVRRADNEEGGVSLDGTDAMKQ